MELRDYSAMMWRWLWLIIISTLVAMIAAYYTLSLLHAFDRYKATATVILRNEAERGALNSDTLRAVRSTYIAMAQRPPMTDKVIATLQLPLTAAGLKERLAVEGVGDTWLIEIAVTYSNAQVAAAIANEVAKELVNADLVPKDTLSPGLSVALYAEAKTPNSREFTPYLILVIAGALGMVLAVGVVMLFESLNAKIRTAKDIRRELQLPVIATVKLPTYRYRRPNLHGKRFWGKNANGRQANGPLQHLPADILDGCHLIQVSLNQVLGHRPTSLLITSPKQLTTSSLLAESLAVCWRDQQVDVQLHRGYPPRIVPLFATDRISQPAIRPIETISYRVTENGNVTERKQYTVPLNGSNNRHGFSYKQTNPLLERMKRVASEPKPDFDPGIRVKNGETDLSNNAEVPSTEPKASTASATPPPENHRTHSNLIIYDAPPVLPSPKTVILAAQTESTLLLLKAHRTRLADARDAVYQLQQAGGRIVGICLVQ